MVAGSITRSFACTRSTRGWTSSWSWGRVARSMFSAIVTMIVRLRSKRRACRGRAAPPASPWFRSSGGGSPRRRVNGVRFVYTIDDDDLGELRVFSYLIRAGKTAYLVNFVASADVAAEAEIVFYAIANSLRFGA